MAGTLSTAPDGYTLDVADLAQALGLGAGTAHHSPVCRTLRRLAVFGLAAWDDVAVELPLNGGQKKMRVERVFVADTGHVLHLLARVRNVRT